MIEDAAPGIRDLLRTLGSLLEIGECYAVARPVKPDAARIDIV